MRGERRQAMKQVQADGMIATVRHPGERTVTFAVNGRARSCVQQIIERVDAMGGGWYIVALSSATSIYRDLQGSRARVEGAQISSHKKAGRPSLFTDDPRTFEQQALVREGRGDLLAPLGWRA